MHPDGRFLARLEHAVAVALAFRHLARNGTASTLISLLPKNVQGCGAAVQDHDFHRRRNILWNDQDIEILCDTVVTVIGDCQFEAGSSEVTFPGGESHVQGRSEVHGSARLQSSEW